MTEVRPSFDRPPVVEQAITVMFTPIGGFSIGDLGLFWDRIRKDFPECIAQEPLGQAIETFGQSPTFGIELAMGIAIPRGFYRHDTKGELVQVQNDRFSFNWMLTEGESYPRHETTTSRFWELFELFCSFLSDRGLSKPVLTQCELTNVNIVPLVDFGGAFGSALAAFNLNVPTPNAVSLQLESAHIATHHIMLGDLGNPIGRIHTELQPVRHLMNDQAAVRFDITARGALPKLDGDSARVFFRQARNAINATFLAYTSDEARHFWGEHK